MKKRGCGLGVVLLAVMVYLLFNRTPTVGGVGGPDASGAPGGTHQSSSAAPVPTLVEQMHADLSTPQPLHIRFAGSDPAGALTVDALTDGKGGLTATWTHHERYGGAVESGTFVVVGSTLYMHGADAIDAYTLSPHSLDGNAWYKTDVTNYPGLLFTLADAGMLDDCVTAAAGDVAEAGTATVGGVEVKQFAPAEPPGSHLQLPWELRIATSGPAHLLQWQALSSTLEPQVCTGGRRVGADHYEASSFVGIFDIAYGGHHAVIPPAAAVDLPGRLVFTPPPDSAPT